VEQWPYKSLFLCPRSVVLIGIPRRSGPGALNPVDNLKRWGYEGQIHIVHPHVQEIAGLPVTRRVSELTDPVDLAIIATPRDTVPGIVRECGQKGIRAVVVTNQGFAEADSRGKELQSRMLAEAGKFGIRILGPNTLGVVNAFHRFTSSFMPHDREEVPIGLICQSGLFLVGVTQLIGGMAIVLDVGNACDVDIVDALDWLGSDERLRVIALHAEEVRGGKRFLDVAERVSRRIPVVALKTGRSYEGAQTAASHSGSMAGEDRIVGAAFRKSGIIRVDETQDQFDLVRGFVRLPPMRGPRVAMVTLSGAGGIILLDALERHGLRSAGFSPGTIDGIQSLSPDWMRLGNPIDIWPAVMKKGMRKAFGTALRDTLADANVDGVICIALALDDAEQAHLGAEEVIQEVCEDFDKPVVVWFYGSHAEEQVKKFSGQARALTVSSLESGVRVLAAMAGYEEWKTHRK